jgi:hypothetical protein
MSKVFGAQNRTENMTSKMPSATGVTQNGSKNVTNITLEKCPH